MSYARNTKYTLYTYTYAYIIHVYVYFVRYSCDVNAGRNGIFGACIIICMGELSNTDRRYLRALAGSISLRRRRQTDVPERCRGGDARPRVSEETPGSPVACPERGEDKIYRTTVVRPSPRPRKSNAFPNGSSSTYGIRPFSKEYTIPHDIISSLPPNHTSPRPLSHSAFSSPSANSHKRARRPYGNDRHQHVSNV